MPGEPQVVSPEAYTLNKNATVQQPKRVDFFFWYTFFTFCGISSKVKVI